LATATHDHKRGEDVRARLAVLSERADEWTSLLPGWIERSAPLRSGDAPSAGDIAMLLQMIIGAWPLDLDREDASGRRAFAERLSAWQQKALREAKLRSDWAAPDEAYEKAANQFLMKLLPEAQIPQLLDEITALCGKDRSGWRGQRAGAASSKINRAWRAGHLSGYRLLGF
jgi:maltooligosyltrehalose synthase